MNDDDNNGTNKQPTTDTEKTSLKDSLRLFKDVFWNDLRQAISKELRSKKDNIAAYNMDF
jgi:hypothetical protein